MKSLLLIVLLIGGATAWFVAAKRGSDWYQGYFAKRHSMHRLIGQIDSNVRIEGTGGGGGGGSGGPYIMRHTHTLKSDRPFTEDLLNAIQERVVRDLRSEGITIIRIKDAPGSDSNYPTAGLRLITWGFQVLFDDHGYKGVLLVRLMSKEIGELERHGHQAELFENIVVFPRD